MAQKLAEIVARARTLHLDVFGALHEGGDTILLLGPYEPGFWPHFTASAEFQDGAPDPMDRWSKRVIGALATSFSGEALFPSDGPPYPPFISWALASGRAWSSPVGMLVHDHAGLFVSYRGAIRLPEALPLPDPSINPCESCTEKPCLLACPVSALSHNGYNTTACKTHIRTDDSAACAESGCAARRACPVSQDYGRMAAQSAFHMAAFLRN